MTEFMPGITYPELLIHHDGGPAKPGTAGIYIGFVEEDRFYDAGLNRWYVKLKE